MLVGSVSFSFESVELTRSVFLTIVTFLLTMVIFQAYRKLIKDLKWARKLKVQSDKSLLSESSSTAVKSVKDMRQFVLAPTSAGLVFLLPVVLTTLLFNDNSQAVFLGAGMASVWGLCGLLIDWSLVARYRSFRKLGMIGMAMGVIATVASVIYLLNSGLSAIYIMPTLAYDAGRFLIILFALGVMAGLIAGLRTWVKNDGITSLISLNAFSVYLLIAFLQGKYEIAFLCASMVGALAAYVWLNSFPTRFLMGNVGVYVIIGLLVGLSLVTNTFGVLLIVTICFWGEFVGMFARMIKRFFGSADHNTTGVSLIDRLSMLGWSEGRISVRIVLVHLLLSAVAIVWYLSGLVG